MVAHFKVSCPQCKTTLKLASKTNIPVGKLLKCATCQSTFRYQPSVAARIDVDTFSIICTGCTKRLTVKHTSVGKKIKCPRCQTINLCQKPDDFPSSLAAAASSTAKNDIETPDKPAAKKSNEPAKNQTPPPAVDPGEMISPGSAKPDTKPGGNKKHPACTVPQPVEEPLPVDDWEPAPTIPKKVATPLPAPKPRPSRRDDHKSFGIVTWLLPGIPALIALGVGSYFLLGFVLATPVSNVSGQVFYENTIVTFGQVAFKANDGTSISGEISADGTYEVKGITRGEAIITVIQRNPKFQDISSLRKEAKGKQRSVVPGTEKEHLLPEKYVSSLTSPLRYTVTRSVEKYDIRLQKE